MSKTCENCSKCIVRKHEVSNKVNKICTNWMGSGQFQAISSNEPCSKYTPKGGAKS